MKEKDKTIIVDMNLNQNVVIEDMSSVKRIIKNNVLRSKIGRTLNKLDNKKDISDEKRRKLLRNARDTGYFHLNGFADLYRDSIKISYVTLYRRLWSNIDILKTLVELGYIKAPYKTIGETEKFKFVADKKYWKIQVSYERRRDFIKFIKSNYLTLEQQRGF